MRILSQDRTIDIPYGKLMLRVFDYKDHADIEALQGADENGITLGKYATKKEALDILFKIREAWLSGAKVYCL